ncbi:MAG: hypothetical protein AB1625_02155 [Acidobacteriota bacterium]
MYRWLRLLPLCLVLVLAWTALQEVFLNGLDLSAGATLGVFGFGLAFCLGLGWLLGRFGAKR